jgi:hypothetical protein
MERDGFSGVEGKSEAIMNDSKVHFLGTWLAEGNRRGEDFSHHADQYNHDHGSGTTPMRHALVEQDGQTVGVWVPKDWTDEQAQEALNSNW